MRDKNEKLLKNIEENKINLDNILFVKKKVDSEFEIFQKQHNQILSLFQNKQDELSKLINEENTLFNQIKQYKNENNQFMLDFKNLNAKMKIFEISKKDAKEYLDEIKSQIEDAKD